MPGYIPPRRRNLVPRWRAAAVTMHLPELRSSMRRRRDYDFGLDEFKDALADWEAHRTPSSAAEVVAAAFVADQGQNAIDAARFLAEYEDEAASSLRRSASQTLLSAMLPVPRVQENTTHALIHELRAKALAYPTDPMAWIDLALAYTNRGQAGRAERFIRMAISLAPNNRFVLRSAVRYYLHIHEGERAYKLLDRLPVVNTDPWLTAAKLAAASIVSRRPDDLKDARSLVYSKDFSRYDTSELASQLATIDLQDGHRLRSKKLFEHALQSPTDNTLAQVRWLEDLDTSFSMPSVSVSAPRDFEANALKDFHSGQWEDAITNSWKWYDDEPFARRGPILGSYVASELLQDYERALEFADAGLKSNPRDPALLNNKAYSLAMIGDTSKARECLNLAKPRKDENLSLIPKLATSGAICYREGNVQEGRSWYLKAIEESRAPDLAKVKMMSMMHLALEEVRVRTKEAFNWTKLALDAADESTLPDIIVLRARLRDAFLEMQGRS
jgi:tetratricopeptide (TPR) repeat protein